MKREEIWTNIEKLSELRSQYSCFDEKEQPYYHALSLGIKGIKTLKEVSIIDKIRSEITAISISGQVDEHTMFIRSGEQVKQMALDILDKYKAESEE